LRKEKAELRVEGVKKDRWNWGVLLEERERVGKEEFNGGGGGKEEGTINFGSPKVRLGG